MKIVSCIQGCWGVEIEPGLAILCVARHHVLFEDIPRIIDNQSHHTGRAVSESSRDDHLSSTTQLSFGHRVVLSTHFDGTLGLV